MSATCASCAKEASTRSRLAAEHFCGAACRDRYLALHHEEHGAASSVVRVVAEALPSVAEAWRVGPGRYSVPRRVAAAIGAHLRRIGPDRKRQLGAADDEPEQGQAKKAATTATAAASSSGGEQTYLRGALPAELYEMLVSWLGFLDAAQQYAAGAWAMSERALSTLAVTKRDKDMFIESHSVPPVGARDVYGEAVCRAALRAFLRADSVAFDVFVYGLGRLGNDTRYRAEEPPLVTVPERFGGPDDAIRISPTSFLSPMFCMALTLEAAEADKNLPYLIGYPPKWLNMLVALSDQLFWCYETIMLGDKDIAPSDWCRFGRNVYELQSMKRQGSTQSSRQLFISFFIPKEVERNDRTGQEVLRAGGVTSLSPFDTLAQARAYGAGVFSRVPSSPP